MEVIKQWKFQSPSRIDDKNLCGIKYHRIKINLENQECSTKICLITSNSTLFKLLATKWLKSSNRQFLVKKTRFYRISKKD